MTFSTWRLVLEWTIPLAACAVMGFLLIVLLVRYFVLPFRADVLPLLSGPAPVKRRARKSTALKQVLITVGAAFLVSRALIYVVALIATKGEVFVSPLSPWVRWDASHYLGLAERWYVGEGDPRFHLVFFPLYPLIVRAFYALGMNAALAGTLISNVCLFVSGVALYRLVEMDTDAQTGERAMRLMLFTPLSFFFSIAYSESLFMMLTLLSVLMARKRRFAPAILIGALAANARLLGLLTAVPIFYEYLLVVRERKGGLKQALMCVLKCLPILLGFVAYLFLNYRVSGDPLMFLTYQREHWSQQMGSLFNTLSYTVANALSYPSLELQLGTWIPQLVAILLVIALLAATYRKLNPGDSAYALLTIHLAIAPTWLLSGTRYLTAMYVLYPMLALVTARKRADIAVMAISILGTVAMVTLFFQGGVL